MCLHLYEVMASLKDFHPLPIKCQIISYSGFVLQKKCMNVWLHLLSRR